MIASTLAIEILQTAILYAVAILLERLPRTRTPLLRLTYWRIVLTLSLSIPLFQTAFPAPVHMEIARPFAFAEQAISFASRESFAYSSIALFVALTGIAARLTWLLLGMRQLRRIRLQSERFSVDSAAASAAKDICGPVSIFISPRISVPSSYGYIHRYVLLPGFWNSLDAATQRAALTHEFLHMRRGDWLAHMAEEFLLSIFWFNPVTYGLIGRIRLAREQVVDQETIEYTGRKKLYLRALIALAQSSRPAMPAPCFSAAHQLKKRVEAIQKENHMSLRRTAAVLTYGTFLLTVTSLVVIKALPVHAQAVDGDEKDRVYKTGGDVVAPKVLSRVDPEYTPEAQAANVQGTVVLSLIIGKDGVPRNIRVLKPLGLGLDEKAVEAVGQWHFQPGSRKGEPVAVRANIEMNFKRL